MIDVAPELLEKIQTDFREHLKSSSTINSLYAKVRDGTATYKEANEFAIEAGRILADAYQANISSNVLPDGKMYYNIAKRVIEPTMVNDYELIADAAEQIQNSLNQEAGIGIKAIKPELNRDRVEGIINRLSSEDKYDDVAWLLIEPIKNFSQSIIDDSIRINAKFHADAGLSPKIVRKLAGGCCEWCRTLAGTYSYPDVPHDVYRRHQRCRCTVDYHPGDGRMQNVHTKQWQTKAERDKIEARKIVGLTAEDDVVQKHIRENIIPKQNIDNIVERQQIHRVGSQMYEQRKMNLQSEDQYGPSYLTISDEEVYELVKKYSGKGKISYNRKKEWDSKETIVTNDKIVGVVVNNLNGDSVETSVFKIHYSKNGVHIVPDYPSKKR